MLRGVGTVGVHDVSSCTETLSWWPGWNVSMEALLASAECCHHGRVTVVGPFAEAASALRALLRDGDEPMGITAAQLR